MALESGVLVARAKVSCAAKGLQWTRAICFFWWAGGRGAGARGGGRGAAGGSKGGTLTYSHLAALIVIIGRQRE